MTAWINELRNGNKNLLHQTGFASDFFQEIFSHEGYGTFFDFAKPQILTTVKSSTCTTCDVAVAESSTVNPEVFIELKNVNWNSTLEELVLDYFKDSFISEEVKCRCGDGHIQVDTKQQLVSLPSLILVKLVLEQFHQNEGRIIQKQSLSLGNNLKLQSIDGFTRTYELVSTVAHTGLSGDSAERGHFKSYLKKPIELQEHQWNCYSDLSPILARPESFVEKSDIFIFIHVADEESPRYE